MELTKVKVDAPGKGRPKPTIAQIRANAHVSVANLEDGSGVRIRVSRNLVPVAQFTIKGESTEHRDAIIEFVRKNAIDNGKLDAELQNYRTIEKERKAARAKK